MKNAIGTWRFFWWYSIKENLVEFKMTHHLSYPVGESLNDYIDSLLCSFLYTSSNQGESKHKILILEKNVSMINIWSFS